jgi:hypothetical protein
LITSDGRVSGLDLLVIQIDGIHMDDDLILVAALGVDAADFDRPAPTGAGTSPAGNRTDRANLLLDGPQPATVVERVAQERQAPASRAAISLSFFSCHRHVLPSCGPNDLTGGSLTILVSAPPRPMRCANDGASVTRYGEIFRGAWRVLPKLPF